MTFIIQIRDLFLPNFVKARGHPTARTNAPSARAKNLGRHQMTTEYTVIMTVLSIRFKRPGAYQRLKQSAARRAEPISSAGERLIDEGLRMEAHPGITFRDGPSGRRAGLAAGPDVWEVVGLLRDLSGSVEERVTTAAAQLSLTEAQVRTTSRYYAEFAHEIDAEIAHNDDIADREFAAWEKEHEFLSR